MMNLVKSLCHGASFAILAWLAPVTAHAAGQATVGDAVPGPTPFIADIPVTTSGASLAYASFAVLSKPGSLVPPIASTYSASYLSAHGYLSGSSLTVPVWGLYSGSNNNVALLFVFTDGSISFAIQPVTTNAYMDPCAEIDQPSFAQNRTRENQIGFNYFLLRDFCSSNSPAILDTDGNLRWVGTANVGSIPSILYNNGIYLSDGNTGVERMELTGQVSKIADFGSIGVTSTNQHNMDRGRDGIVVDVNTANETEGVAVEFDPTTGKVLNTWDMAQILSAAMAAGGDKFADFVGSTYADWFHMNATAYNPADGTEIISSRENFVIDVDYDTPPDGVKKIHWILGDTTKKWASFPSLAKYALTLGTNTLPPIGQHAVAIDPSGNLMLFDDGHGSDYEVPAGIERGFSAGRSYKIDTAAMTATEVINYTPSPNIFTPYCGSFYEPTSGSYLIDFPDATTGNTEIQGLGKAFNVVFDLQYPEINRCGSGWNAVPLTNLPLLFN